MDWEIIPQEYTGCRRERLPETEMAGAKNYTHEDTKAKPERRSHRQSKEWKHCSKTSLIALSVFLATEQQELQYCFFYLKNWDI